MGFPKPVRGLIMTKLRHAMAISGQGLVEDVPSIVMTSLYTNSEEQLRAMNVSLQRSYDPHPSRAISHAATHHQRSRSLIHDVLKSVIST